ncbi:MAG: ribonuclease P [Candidatus Odinarchaeum yellowstonii]|uniref:Ribonuclease P protein component 2 n=1 Tax=Odinarchaeota yellowstonii (strain LCB_4) TaxID=1841599 RepID=A0AAF0D1B0_ODILC|nr:MAG: ribonuclease P [Candidatus Odinarchaeum yellowstonii]
MSEISSKPRKRYLVFQILYDGSLCEKDVLKIISNQLIRLFGEVGASKTHFWLHSYDEASKKGIIECRHKTVPLIRATLASIFESASQPLTIYTIGVSGTMKTAKRKYLNI